MMLRRLHWTAAIAALLLGGVHVAYTARLHHDLTLDALWFAGTGLALIAIALLNITALRAEGRGSPGLVLAANLVTTGFFALIWTVHEAPQVMAGLVLFVVLTGCASRSLWLARDRAHQS